MSQTTKKSIIESLTVTLFGTLIGFTLSFIIFPLFGVYTSTQNILGITLIFLFIGLIKNFVIRRVFNYLHNNPKFFLDSIQNRYQSLLESGFQTIFGTVLSFWSSVWIYPYFNINVPMLNIGGITLTFMVASIIKNFLVRRHFESINK